MSTKRKLAAKLGQPTLKPSAKPLGKATVDESRTVVLGPDQTTKTTANGVLEISDSSSAEEDDEEEEEHSEEEDEAEDEQEEIDEQEPEQESESPAEAADVSMDDAPEEESAEPSFGDLVRAHAAEPIDVAEAFDATSPGDQAYPKAVQVQAPPGASLGTVLTQALRTNDVNLLESCLHTTDLNTIRATIQRLDSPLAGTLLQKLAERLHRRPGRAGSLMVWVQWTLVTHGGYLATQRDLVKKLAELNRVIDERAKGLQSLLSLKGKLDMLEAQIELRKAMQNRQGEEDEEDEDVIYVEGQESESEAGEGEGEETVRKPKRLARNGDLEDISDGESEESEDMPMTNGVGNSEDEESESSEDDDVDDLIDDEAEETDEDHGDEYDVDHDDQDEEGEDDESDDAGAPPPKMQRTGVSSRRR